MANQGHEFYTDHADAYDIPSEFYYYDEETDAPFRSLAVLLKMNASDNYLLQHEHFSGSNMKGLSV